MIEELNYYLKLLMLCYLFSKKPFPVFLESGGFSMEDVLFQKPKATLLEPAFTILRDKDSKCFLMLMCGIHSIKDTLTATTGAVAPFHHSVLDDGGISNLVLGYAHYGMVAAARWIAQFSTPCLLKALGEYPEYIVKRWAREVEKQKLIGSGALDLQGHASNVWSNQLNTLADRFGNACVDI